MTEEKGWVTIEVDPTKVKAEDLEIEIAAPEPSQQEAPKEPPKKEVEEPAPTKEPELEGVDTQGAQKRIRKLIAQRKAERERADQAEAAAKAERERIARLEAQVEELTRGTSTSKREQIRGAYDAAQRAYIAAREKGDTAEELKALQAMQNANLQWDRLEREPAPKREEPKQEQRQEPQPSGINPRAQEWVDAQDWWEKDAALRAVAGTIAAQLANEGFHEGDDETYAELDKRLRAEMPHKFSRGAVSQPKQTVAGGSRSPSSRPRVTLDAGEVEMARRLGLSTEEYARQKLVTEQSKRNDGTYGYMSVDISRRK